jgi:hypothetical protein
MFKYYRRDEFITAGRKCILYCYFTFTTIYIVGLGFRLIYFEPWQRISHTNLIR